MKAKHKGKIVIASIAVLLGMFSVPASAIDLYRYVPAGVGFGLFSGSDAKKTILSGRILDAETAQPVAAVIRIPERDIEPLVSDPFTGEYEIELKAGVYRVRAEAEGYKWKEKGVVIQEGDKKVLDFTLERGSQAKAQVAGLVKDSETDQALEGVEVDFDGPERVEGKKTDVLGIFKAFIQPGDYVITFSKKGYDSREVELSVSPSQFQQIDMVLCKKSYEVANAELPDEKDEVAFESGTEDSLRAAEITDTDEVQPGFAGEPESVITSEPGAEVSADVDPYESEVPVETLDSAEVAGVAGTEISGEPADTPESKPEEEPSVEVYELEEVTVLPEPISEPVDASKPEDSVSEKPAEIASIESPLETGQPDESEQHPEFLAVAAAADTQPEVDITEASEEETLNVNEEEVAEEVVNEVSEEITSTEDAPKSVEGDTGAATTAEAYVQPIESAESQADSVTGNGPLLITDEAAVSVSPETETTYTKVDTTEAGALFVSIPPVEERSGRTFAEKAETPSIFPDPGAGLPEFGNVHFNPGSTEISEVSTSVLKEVLGFLQANPSLSLAIAGHTDSVGDEETNLVISRKRAQAVKAWLVERGIEESRLSAAGYGESRPIADNRTRSGKNANRRIEFVLTE